MRDVQRWFGLTDVEDQPDEPESEPAEPRWVRLLRRVGVAGQVFALMVVCTVSGAAGTVLVDAAAAAFTAGRDLLGLEPDPTEPCWRVRERVPGEEPLRT